MSTAGSRGRPREVTGKFESPDAPMMIGFSPRKPGFPGGRFKGLVEQVRISKHVRYTGDFTRPEVVRTDPETELLLEINEGWGDVVYDSSGNNRHGRIIGAKWLNLKRANGGWTP